MTKDEALQMCLEYIETDAHERKYVRHAIKAALEAKDEKANDELRRLHDLLGKANALARIRANKIDELEQRLTKTEAQLGEAVWNYGELKREQLANQQKTSGSPINTSTALEAKDEPVACKECHLKDTVYDLLGDLKVANLKLSVQSMRTWVELTDEEITEIFSTTKGLDFYLNFARAIEAKLKEKNT